MLQFAELDLVPKLEVVSFHGKRATRRTGIFGGQRDLLPSEIVTLGGVRVTRPDRTACDLARLRGRRRGLAVLDAFRREFGLTIDDLRSLLPRYVGQRGVVQLRELIPLSTDRAESQPESWLRMMIHDEGIPMPQPQVDVYVPGWGEVRIENAYEHLRIGVEYDGEAWHSTDDERRHDRDRRAALRDELGWHIIVVRKDGFSAPQADRWLRELKKKVKERKAYRPTKRIYSRAPNEPNRYWTPRRT